MAQSELQTKLGDYVEDAHAMESNVLQMLDSMIATTEDKQILRQLKQHRQQTERHQKRLQARLEDLDRGASARKEAQSLAGALLKGVTDRVRGDKPGKNARDGFITEHMEIAAYELLERLAERAGDRKTAQVARQNRRDEESMAKKIANNWDKIVDLTLAEEGIEAPKKRSVTRRRSSSGTRKSSTSGTRRTSGSGRRKSSRSGTRKSSRSAR
jgi:ferritin-like metal-binding protein YciE